MIIFRRARGLVGKSAGAVTQALEYLAQGQPTCPDHGNSPAAQHAALQRSTPKMPFRMVISKATDTTAEQSESSSSKQKVADVTSTITASGTTASNASSGHHNHNQDETETEMGEDKFQNVLLAAALKHVVCP
jgi:hypothetical protein